jgi:hypothetical protein
MSSRRENDTPLEQVSQGLQEVEHHEQVRSVFVLK